MEMIGEPLSETQLTQLLAIADLDQDGRINYEGKWDKKLSVNIKNKIDECKSSLMLYGEILHELKNSFR